MFAILPSSIILFNIGRHLAGLTIHRTCHGRHIMGIGIKYNKGVQCQCANRQFPNIVSVFFYSTSGNVRKVLVLD